MSFTEREKELIQQYASGDKKLVMACSTDRDPYSYEENGELKGILPDLCQIIMESAGIPYDTIVPESREQYSQWQQDEVMDFTIDARVSEQFIEEHDYSASVPYITMKLARVTRRDFDGNIQKVAVARYQGLANIENQFIGDAEVITCDSREEALQAVLYGKADATYTYVYSAQKFVNTDERALFTYTILEEPSFSYQFLFTSKVNHELSGIISKCIYALPEGEVSRIISEYTSYKAENINFTTLTRLHPGTTILLIFLLICILITIAVLITMLHSRKQLLVFETKKAEEMNQLAKKAQSASESKSRFLSNMSHDIRTPMNAIIGFTRLAMEAGTDTEKVQGYLSKILISSKHLLSIVNKVLEMSRIESGRFQLHEKPCYIPDVIEEATVIIQEQTLERHQHFTVDINDIQDLHVICDPLRIREILINMDIQMPLMNGYEAARKIRKLSNPELSQIPIIAVSANAFEEDKAASLEAGMNAHIGKPIKNEELLQALGSLLL